MAATFFATLVPGDGPANYAGFMTRMSATLERIARMAVDKDEKRAREPEERDQENQQPGAKRHNHRTVSTSHQKTRQGSTLRASRASNSHNHLATSATNKSTTNPTLRDLGIPETLEGFPPVNSSGYVVPMSPGSTTFTRSPDQDPTTPTTTSYPTGLGLTNLTNPPPTTFQSNIPPWSLTQDNTNIHTTTTSPLDLETTNSQSPYSQTSSTNTAPHTTTTTNTNTIPDSWQVPLTADWSYGDNLWAGLFPTETIAASAQAQHISLPILSAESFLTIPPGEDGASGSNETELGYGGTSGYDFASGTSAQGMNSWDGEQGGESLWPNGVLGLF